MSEHVQTYEEVSPQIDEPPFGHAMLPNDSHPGPGCSCRECLSQYPEAR